MDSFTDAFICFTLFCSCKCWVCILDCSLGHSPVRVLVVSLLVRLFVCLFICLFVCSFVCLTASFLSLACLSVYLVLVCLFVCLSVMGVVSGMTGEEVLGI